MSPLNDWERQENETPTAFTAFHEYYLPQDNPRSVNEAYRRWYANRYKLSASDDRVTKKVATGLWQNWSKGQAHNGKPVKGLKNWPDRARAFDDHLAALRQAEWERQHMSQAEALAILASHARGSLGDFFKTWEGIDGGKIDLKKAEEAGLMHLLHRIEFHDTGVVKKIELQPQQKATELVLRALGVFDKGGEDDPFFTVEMTLDEWQARQAKSRQDIDDTLAEFDE